MGCGNSSPTSTTAQQNNSSSKTGHAECSSKISDDSPADDDKRKNYGGVYVGLPTDLNNAPQVQIGSLRDTHHVFISCGVCRVRGAWEKKCPNCRVSVGVHLYVYRVSETQCPLGSRCGEMDSNFNEASGFSPGAIGFRRKW